MMSLAERKRRAALEEERKAWRKYASDRFYAGKSDGLRVAASLLPESCADIARALREEADSLAGGIGDAPPPGTAARNRTADAWGRVMATKIKIATDRGTADARCVFRLGVWAATEVHGSGGTAWTITHVPSGAGAPRFLTRDEAVAACAIVGARYPKVGARQKLRAKRMPRGWPAVAKFITATLVTVGKAAQ